MCVISNSNFDRLYKGRNYGLFVGRRSGDFADGFFVGRSVGRFVVGRTDGLVEGFLVGRVVGLLLRRSDGLGRIVGFLIASPMVSL